MSAYVNQAKKLLCEAGKQASKLSDVGMPYIVNTYKTTMEQNAKYVVKDPAQAAVLHKQLLYTNLAKIPATIEHATAEYAVVKKTAMNYNELSLSQVGTGALFAAETYAWFCLGEFVGRGFTLTGYQVPGM
eukprot:CAMPEP_0118932410 /NCGR_PEP_ID=MMETSP1169-20130426/10152_1 /TAXON_ID=36882 /ORGANISM="Pyramimonas obovata, Strain CCMP722" /LENGTH=130 /DNA_ID=CAMNT_0006875061 /DNA_START=42 /DNA_END=434 /DNA_ORIENTATION=-